MSQHKITATRTGFHESVGDWESEHVITFSFTPGAAPIIHPADNADPGYPAEVEFVSISPGASDVGAFTDLAQRDLEDWAREWLRDDGYAEALAVVTADDERGREYAAELRSDA